MHSGKSTQSAGVGILINPKSNIKSAFVEHEIIPGRAIAITIAWEGVSMTIASVYLTSGASEHATRQVELQEIENSLKSLNTNTSSSNIILGGDWNCMEHQIDIKRHPAPKHETYQRKNKEDITRLQKELQLEDWYHTFHSPSLDEKSTGDGAYEYTHTKINKDNQLFTRLDRFYNSSNLSHMIKNITCMPRRHESDHDGIILTLGKVLTCPKKAQWYLNKSLLQDATFLKQHLEFLDSMKSEIATITSPKGYEKVKNKIVANLKSLSKSGHDRVNQELKAKESELRIYKHLEEAGSPILGSTKIKREQLKREVTDHYERTKNNKQLNAATIRRLFFDRASKPYFALEKSLRMNNDRIITSLKSKIDPNLEKFTTKEIIDEIAQPFYSKLYSKKTTKKLSQVQALQSISKKFSCKSRDFLEKDFNKKEVKSAIKALGAGKAPGIDGLPIEYYHTFDDHMSTLLEKMFKVCLNNRTLSKSSRTSIISILHKKKEKNIIENYRPISLTCNDYKIFSKMLQLRFNEVINEIIDIDQNGFIPNRFIGENNMLLHELILHMQKLAEDEEGTDEGYLLFLDFEKAFDRVDHNFMFDCLTKFGIGENFLNMIKLLYANAQSKVRVNNTDSEPFDLHSGVRQGCPLSPLLFACVVETMACLMREDPNIEGIPIPGTDVEVRLSQHADDTVIIFRNFDESFPHFKECINTFCKASGMKINQDKTEGLMLGKRGLSETPEDFGCNWDHDTPIAWTPAGKYLRSLGTQLTNSADLSHFWDELVEKITKRLDNWNTFWPNIMSKILISKLSLLSCIWYFTQNMEVPPKTKSQLQNAITHFVWSSKTSKIDMGHLNKGHIGLDQTIQSNSNRGIKMLHVGLETAAFAARWVSRLLSPSKPHQLEIAGI